MLRSDPPIGNSIQRRIPKDWEAEDWDRVLIDIESDTCIPIIGRSLSRVYLKDKVESSDLYQSLLLYINALSDSDKDAETLDELFFTRTQNRRNEEMFNRDFSVFIKNNPIDSKPIEDLLNGWKFPAIINLCPSGACQQALNNLGIPFTAVNISATEGVQSFTEQACDERVKLINVFGTVLGKTHSFALATHQQLTFLLKLASESTENYLPKNPRHYQFLGVGCQTPDWLGRILIHWLSEGKSVSEVRLSSIDSKHDIDKRFEQYASLGGQGFKFISSDPLEFSARFSEYIEHLQKETPGSAPPVRQSGAEKPSVFFSFIGDPDRDAVVNVSSRIRNLSTQPGVVLPSLFIDEDMKPGEQGMEEILRKLEGMRQFVIFVSLRSMTGVLRGQESDAFFEWKAITKKDTRMGNQKHVVFVVFIYDQDPDRERKALQELLLSRFSDSHGFFSRFFLDKSSSPQVVYFPRDPLREQARDSACISLAEALVQGRHL